jgi:hypothetical protein
MLCIPNRPEESEHWDILSTPYSLHSLVFLELSVLSIAFFIVFSNIFLASQKPCFVLPNEFGPAEVGVSLQQKNVNSLSFICI